jgi:methyltransferase (TIGR00027 family)
LNVLYAFNRDYLSHRLPIMIEARPSRTAHRVALRRALHQVWDAPTVFDDPLALQIVGHDAVAAFAASESPDASRSLRAFLVARSRYAEDQLALAVQRGLKQYVILGAGVDTFGYRNPFPNLQVYEVDHPATQAWKARLLEASGIVAPRSLSFAPVDFENDTLENGLMRVGFRKEEPAFFSCLGVTPYLAKETTLATLRWIISACAGNGVAFDYVVPRESLSANQRVAFDELAGRVSAAGEPFVGFFDPLGLAGELTAMGYAHIEDLGAKEINLRYFRDRADTLSVGNPRLQSIGRLVCASGK